MASPRPIGTPTPDPTQPAASSPSLAVPQIPQRPSSPASTFNSYGSPRRSPAFPTSVTASPAAGASNLTRSRDDSSQTPPNAILSASLNEPALTEQQKADVIRRHLLSADEQARLADDQALQSGISLPAGSPGGRSAFPQDEAETDYPTPYHLEGGDVVAGVYKWAAQQAEAAGGTSPGALGGAGATPAIRRSKSMASVTEGITSRRASHALPHERAAFRAGLDGEEPATEEGPEFSTAEMLQPGGFRRDFVFRRMAERGETPIPDSDVTSEIDASGVSLSPAAGRRPTRSFIDFLSLYGHFGGENLEEVEEEDEDSLGEDEEAAVGAIPPFAGRGVNERTPLIRGRSESRKRAAAKDQGDATVTQAVMMLLKSFVGTGVLFLGKAFFNGGILFSAIVLCFIAMISLYSFLLLVECRLVIHGSFGDIGGALYGKYMRWSILSSIVLSQIGFVSAYIIFVAENLQAFVTAVTNCRTVVSIPLLIAAQLVIFLPLALIRNIQKLSGTALVADVFIVIGLVYIFSNEISVLASHGIAEVELFNRDSFPLLIGTAVFAFEGIGLIIPVQEAMKEPHRLPRVLTGVMIGVMFLFAGGGVLSYLTFGEDIQTVVFVNLPQDDKFVNASQFLYSLAILLSTPLQLFPAVRIMENGLFAPQKSGKHSNKVKWEKNAFRTVSVAACALIAWLGANDLDKFVSLIGSLACVPLGLVYPALLHYKACARTRKQRIIDISLMIFGVLCAIYTTSQTIQLLLAPAPAEGAKPPAKGRCPIHI
ncbi:hypothetical protein JCM11641_006731 [Rhodosporidiobolus odoratus]